MGALVGTVQVQDKMTLVGLTHTASKLGWESTNDNWESPIANLPKLDAMGHVNCI